MGARARLRRWLGEPLTHFLVIGFGLFLYFDWAGGGATGSGRIVVSAGRIEALAAGFARTRQRPPTGAELDGLVADYVREELATREALALGLDRDDTIVRRRLRQKLEFLNEDAADALPPSEAEIEAWFAAHGETFRVEERAAFRHVYLSRERRGATLARDARETLAKLSAMGEAADLSPLGDPILLPGEVPLSSRSAIAREFGDAFAERVTALEPGHWSGPIDSAYGVHLVWIVEREDGRLPALSEVRAAVEREVAAERRRQHLDGMYDRLRARYAVVIESPDEQRADAVPPDAGAEAQR